MRLCFQLFLHVLLPVFVFEHTSTSASHLSHHCKPIACPLPSTVTERMSNAYHTHVHAQVYMFQYIISYVCDACFARVVVCCMCDYHHLHIDSRTVMLDDAREQRNMAAAPVHAAAAVVAAPAVALPFL